MDQDNLIEVLELLAKLMRRVSQGSYEEAEKLADFVNRSSYPDVIHELADAFGMMAIHVQVREVNLENLVEELEEKNKALESTLKRVRLLESVKHELGKFVPRQVRDQIENNPANPDLDRQDRDVSVLFLDIAGYTRLSERNDFNRVNALVEQYFSAFIDEIARNKGDVNETAGDGLMVIFQDADPKQHAINAVRSALHIRKKTDEINRQNTTDREPVTINIGINSGTCSVGSARYEGLSGTRWTYSASGPVTNIAARLSTLAADGAILIGSEVASRVNDNFTITNRGLQTLRNVSRPLTVFEVLTDTA